MKFTSPLYAVKSITESVAFYRDVLGQKVVLDFGANVTFESGFSLQEGLGELAGFDPALTVWRAYDGELYFESEDLDGDAQHLKRAGVALLHEIRPYPWGQRVLRFYDPNGHLVELGESMKSVVLRFLDQGMSEEETAQRTQHPPEFVRWCRENP